MSIEGVIAYTKCVFCRGGIVQWTDTRGRVRNYPCPECKGAGHHPQYISIESLKTLLGLGN